MAIIKFVAASLIAFYAATIIGVAEPMHFENACRGNHVETCYIIATGEITSETPKVFETYLEGHSDGFKILFDSPGGSLGAGVKLGRIVRENELTTVVGRWINPEGGGEPGPGGICHSACAYAFVGGITRRIDEGNSLGFHQFYLGESSDNQSVGALSSAQIISGQLISYLIEMGVDARIFSKASQTDQGSMFVPSAAELLEYDLVTPRGFGRIFLEPYKEGLVAASKRQTETRPYDEVTQITAYCRDGNAYLLLTALSHGLTNSIAGPLDLEFRNGDDEIEISVSAENVKVWSNDQGGFIEAKISKSIQTQLLKSDWMLTSFFAGRVSGGDFTAELDLKAKDKRMISAAFRFCI